METQRYRGNFTVALKGLIQAESKQVFATPAQGMQERMRQGVDADISGYGAWYNASFNEVNGRILGTRGEFNPLIGYAEQVVKAMRTGEFYLDGVLINGRNASEVLEEIVERDVKKPVYKKRVADFGEMETYNVPTDCFGDDDVIVFLSEGKTRANKYGLWLKKDAGIDSVKVYMQNLTGKNKSRGFWFVGLVGIGRSGFSCNYRGLNDGSVFGVREGAEGTAQKISGQSKQNRITSLNLSQVLKYSKSFIPSRDWGEFKRGLEEKFKKE